MQHLTKGRPTRASLLTVIFLLYSAVVGALNSCPTTETPSQDLGVHDDLGIGLAYLECPINSNIPGNEVLFYWDPDDCQQHFETGQQLGWPRLGELWEVTANQNDTGTFPNFTVRNNSPVEICLIPPQATSFISCCAQSGIDPGTPFRDTSHNLYVFPDNGMTFYWHVQECSNIVCTNKWTSTVSFVNGPSAVPGQAAPYNTDFSSSADDVSLDWKNGDRSLHNSLKVSGQYKNGLFKQAVFLDPIPNYDASFGPLVNYPVVGADLPNFNHYRDGRTWNWQVKSTNSLGVTKFTDPSLATFRIPADRVPEIIDPSMLGVGNGYHFSTCVVLKPQQSIGSFSLTFVAGKSVNPFDYPVYSTGQVFHPKTHSGAFNWCPPPEDGQHYWYVMNGWNQDYGDGPGWGAAFEITNDAGEYCALPQAGSGMGSREAVNHVDSCLQDDPNQDVGVSYKLWDKARFLNRNPHGHNGLLGPPGTLPGTFTGGSKYMGGIFVQKLDYAGQITNDPHFLVSQANNYDWGMGDPADFETNEEQDGLQTLSDTEALYDTIRVAFGMNGVCGDGDEMPIGISVAFPVHSDLPWGDVVNPFGNIGVTYYDDLSFDIVDEGTFPFVLPIPHRFTASMGWTGHAWGHRYLSQCNFSSGFESPEGRAVMESFANLWGAMLKSYVLQHGEGIWELGNGMGVPMEEMDDPHFSSQARLYVNDPYWWPAKGKPAVGLTCSANDYSYYNSYCGAHINDGVGNYALYLLVNGGTHPDTHITVGDIGMAKAFAIALRAARDSWYDGIDYPSWAGAMVVAASDLYGKTSVEHAQTFNAWKAVGVTPASVSGQPVPTPAPCYGDCNGDQVVGIGDITTVTRILLTNASLAGCPLGDVNRSGSIDLGDLILMINFSSTGTCIPVTTSIVAPDTYGIPQPVVTIGKVSTQWTNDVIEIPISAAYTEENNVAAIQLQFQSLNSAYDSVQCYLDESLDDNYSMAVASKVSGTELLRNLILTSNTIPPMVIPDGVFAVCEFNMSSFNPKKETIPIQVVSMSMADRLGNPVLGASTDGSIVLRNGCAIGEPTRSTGSMVMMLVPVLLLLVARYRPLLMVLILALATSASALDVSGLWVRTSQSTKYVRTSAHRLNLPTEDTAGDANRVWLVNDLAVNGHRVSAKVTMAGVSFAPVSFQGVIIGNRISGRLLNIRGARVASLRGTVRPTGVTGAFRSISGESGTFEWRGSAVFDYLQR